MGPGGHRRGPGRRLTAWRSLAPGRRGPGCNREEGGRRRSAEAGSGLTTGPTLSLLAGRGPDGRQRPQVGLGRSGIRGVDRPYPQPSGGTRSGWTTTPPGWAPPKWDPGCRPALPSALWGDGVRMDDNAPQLGSAEAGSGLSTGPTLSLLAGRGPDGRQRPPAALWPSGVRVVDNALQRRPGQAGSGVQPRSITLAPFPREGRRQPGRPSREGDGGQGRAWARADPATGAWPAAFARLFTIRYNPFLVSANRALAVFLVNP